MKLIDTKGMKCPQPLVMARKTLKEIEEGEIFELITDNDASRNNLKRFLADNNTPFELSSNAGIHSFKITKVSGIFSSGAPGDYCEAPTQKTEHTKADYVVVFDSETMGSGNEDLGMILTKSFLTSLGEAAKLPAAILFYNSGVKLALKDSLVLREVSDLQEKGVKILLCGTCLNFYNIKNDIAVGLISNMLEITEIMATASKIIYS
ncbi:MAG TPA: sulfurtransferase-like selenium metabolism protein YedF [Bacteroidales bacterium]|nr:sulfurtransferase-like selenium metabolism protein YedF [Bacteroidales bacterium]